MKQNFMLLLAVLLLSAVACDKNDTAVTFQLDKPFTLEHNNAIPWEEDPSVRIRFDKTVADSRCPIDVICVWAGRAEVDVAFTQGGQTETKTLALGDLSGTSLSNIATFGDFTVELRNVLPAPKSDHQIKQSEYTLDVVVKKE